MITANPHPTGPFATAAIELYRHGLAVIPVGGDEGKVPLVAWAKWTRPPGRDFLLKLIRRDERNGTPANVGIITGLSRITVVDIDDPALIDMMVTRFGDTPLKIRTPSGGLHLWYRYSGERTTDLRKSESLAVDVKAAGGVVVVPPSIRPSGDHAGAAYEFVAGSWDDLTRLPTVPRGRLPLVEKDTGTGTIHPLRTVSEGNRNDFLFRTLLREVHACDDVAALTDVAESINANFDPPLADTEVAKLVKSAWRYESEGKNWAGKDARAVTTASELNALVENLDALALRCVLQVNHGARTEPFAVSPSAMAKVGVIPGWGTRRYAAARRWLTDKGFLKVAHEGGRGPRDAWLFTLSSALEMLAAKGTVSVPNITKHPSLLFSAPAFEHEQQRQQDGGSGPSARQLADPLTFGRLVKAARQAHGFSQAQAAAIVGMSRSGFGNVETGTYSPGYDLQQRLADAFGLDTWAA